MKRDDYREITGSGYIKLIGDVLDIDSDWITTIMANSIHENQKLNIEMDVIVITEEEYDGNSFMLCSEGVFDKDTQELTAIDYISIIDSDNEFHLNNLITDDLLIDHINYKISALNNDN